MVKRRSDGTLRQTSRLPSDDWLRDANDPFRSRVIEKEKEFGRPLTENELDEVDRSLATGDQEA